MSLTDPRQQEICWATPKGEVCLCSFCSAQQIQGYRFDSQFGSHAQYKSLYTRKESLVLDADHPGTNVTLALAEQTHIVGFGVLAYPDADERWARLGDRVMKELKVIEVGRHWRSTGLAKGVVKAMLSFPTLEDKIIYLVGYSWTWDLDGTGKTAPEYRMMLIKLFEPFGFKEFQTNEPNICLRPENIFMARIGNRISSQTRTNFKWLLFDMYP